MRTTATTPNGALVHEALLYRDDREYVRGIDQVVRSGLAAGRATLVAVPQPRLDLLREALASSADDVADVSFADMRVAGRNPTAIIPSVLEAFAEQHPGRPLTIVGEPIWPEQPADSYATAVQHEALINLAFADRPISIVCPYDAARLEPAALQDAERTHPRVADHEGARTSSAYGDPATVAGSCLRLADPPSGAVPVDFDASDLATIRVHVAARADDAGLTSERVVDLQIAVNEVATNAVIHAGSGVLRIWEADGSLVCEISSRGQLSDPLTGRRRPAHGQPGGRGLLLANLLCDLLQIESGHSGTRVRLHAQPS